MRIPAGPRSPGRITVDLDVINVFLAGLYDDLVAYYAQDIPAAAKIVGRETVFQAARDHFAADIQPTLNYPETFTGYANLPSNNAWMLGHRRYNLDLDLFASIYEAVDSDWSAALDVYRAAANADSDPFDFLRNWLTENTD